MASESAPSRDSAPSVEATPPWLDHLAEALIARHLAVSLPDAGLREQLRLEQPFIEMTERKMRCVAVVGAGASARALPRGDKLAAELREACNVPQQYIEAELARQKQVFGQDPDQFE